MTLGRPIRTGRILLWCALAFFAGVWAGLLLEREVAIDRCLDLGGRWDDERRNCAYNGAADRGTPSAELSPDGRVRPQVPPADVTGR